MARSKKKRKKAKRGEQYSVALFTASVIAALLLPLIVYTVLLLAVFHAPESPWMILGFIGAFLIGIGCANLAASIFWKFHEWRLTVILFGSGALLISVSSLLIFHSVFDGLFDMEMVSYLFITLGFLAFSLIFYMFFRFTLDSWLKRDRGLSRTHVQKMKKGKRNYWWYEQLHREIGLGVLYGLNKLYTVLFAVAFALTLLTGYFRPMSIPICVLVVAVSLITGVMAAFAYAQHNREEHGSYVVLFARNSRKGIDSVFFDLILVVFMLVMAYAHVMLTAQLWGIELPHL